VFQIDFTKRHRGLCLGQEICRWHAHRAAVLGLFVRPGCCEQALCPAQDALMCVAPCPEHPASAAPRGCKPTSLAWEKRSSAASPTCSPMSLTQSQLP
jgi:hypothetical protein